MRTSCAGYREQSLTGDMVIHSMTGVNVGEMLYMCQMGLDMLRWANRHGYC